MNPYELLRYIIVPLALCVIGWELWSGKALNRWWKVVALRSENPTGYWLNIVLQCVAVAAILIFLGRMGR